MPTDEKPLLPTSNSPASSTRSLPSQLPPTSPAAKLLLQATSPPSHLHKRRSIFGSNRKRFLALVVAYAVVAAVWYRDVHARAWTEAIESIERWRDPLPCVDGSGAVCDAYGHPFVEPPRLEVTNASIASSSQPLSVLGWEADNVYHLGSPTFVSNPAVYLSTLETFLRTHFPVADSDESDPNSLINALRSFFPSSETTAMNRRIRYTSIPRTIWQTAPTRKYYDDKEDIAQTWTEMNEGWDVRFHDNELADRWVRKRFGSGGIEKRAPRRRRNRKARKGVHSSSSASQHASSTDTPTSSVLTRPKIAAVMNEERGVLAAWDRLETPAVLRSDFWRYLVLAVEGGVYADTDVECMKPIDQWGLDVDWEGSSFVLSSLSLCFARSRRLRAI